MKKSVPKVPVDEQPDPACKLFYEFLEKRRALSRPPIPFDFNTKEFNQEWKQRKKAEIRFYRDYLAQLEEAHRQAEGKEATQQILVAKAHVRIELAMLLYDQDELWDILEQALEDAYAAEHEDTVYTVLIRIGHSYREYAAYEDAVWYYQEALVYAGGGSLFQTDQVFFWLGVTFAYQEQTLPQAVFMFDWAGRFGPLQFNSLIEKYKCRLRLGQREDIVAEAVAPLGTTCEEIAETVAALIALGRRKKAVCRAAQKGIEAAEREQDHRWKALFERYAGSEATSPNL
jgi:hypothetical protein